MSAHDTIDVARRQSTEEVPVEKYDDKDLHHPADDQVTVLGAGGEHELATKA